MLESNYKIIAKQNMTINNLDNQIGELNGEQYKDNLKAKVDK